MENVIKNVIVLVSSCCGYSSLIFGRASCASEETSAICTVALYGPKLDCSTVWQGPHKTSPRPLEYMVLSLPTVLTLCNTLNSSSKFNQHTFYHFWVQMAAGSPREDIYGHIQCPLHSESPVRRPSQASFRGCWKDEEEAAL